MSGTVVSTDQVPPMLREMTYESTAWPSVTTAVLHPSDTAPTSPEPVAALSVATGRGTSAPTALTDADHAPWPTTDTAATRYVHDVLAPHPVSVIVNVEADGVATVENVPETERCTTYWVTLWPPFDAGACHDRSTAPDVDPGWATTAVGADGTVAPVAPAGALAAPAPTALTASTWYLHVVPEIGRAHV